MEEEIKQPDQNASPEQNTLPQQEVIGSVERNVIEAQIIEALRTCFDPEIPVNIYDLGLIYGVKVGTTGDVVITMTLTTPYCPAAQSMPSEVQQKVQAVSGVKSVHIDIVWEPPWNPSKMSESARLELGFL